MKIIRWNHIQVMDMNYTFHQRKCLNRWAISNKEILHSNKKNKQAVRLMAKRTFLMTKTFKILPAILNGKDAL